MSNMKIDWRMKEFLLLSIVIFFIISGCKKTELSGDLSKYVGTWKNDSHTTTIVLNTKGRGDYLYDNGLIRDEKSDSRILIEGSTLTFLKGKNKILRIDSPPQGYLVLSGYIYTAMILNGEKFIKD